MVEGSSDSRESVEFHRPLNQVSTPKIDSAEFFGADHRFFNTWKKSKIFDTFWRIFKIGTSRATITVSNHVIYVHKHLFCSGTFQFWEFMEFSSQKSRKITVSKFGLKIQKTGFIRRKYLSEFSTVFDKWGLKIISKMGHVSRYTAQGRKQVWSGIEIGSNLWEKLISPIPYDFEPMDLDDYCISDDGINNIINF